MPEPFEIQLLRTGDSRLDDALRMILCGDPNPGPRADQYVASMRAVVAEHGLRMDLLLVAVAGERLLSAVLGLESPGATALVYTPASEPLAGQRRALVALLAAIQPLGWQRDLALLQALVQLGETWRSDAFAEAGFLHLADLVYMDRPTGLAPAKFKRDMELRMISFDERHRRRFIEAIERSYEDSRDCPGLFGLRRTEDVLAGHRATGVFDPNGWVVAMMGDSPAGVLLTSGVIGRSAIEVVYMGVCRAFRGQGIGHRLMFRAVQEAKRLGVGDITLAVDGSNAPARRLYNTWGFAETHRRCAWIVSPPTM